MHDLSQAKAVILVFASPECPACLEYKPRFEAEIERWKANKAPFVYVDEEQPKAGDIAIAMIDVTSEHESVQGLADQFAVQALPTTVVLTRTKPQIRHEGSLEAPDIYNLLIQAVT